MAHRPKSSTITPKPKPKVINEKSSNKIEKPIIEEPIRTKEPVPEGKSRDKRGKSRGEGEGKGKVIRRKRSVSGRRGIGGPRIPYGEPNVPYGSSAVPKTAEGSPALTQELAEEQYAILAARKPGRGGFGGISDAVGTIAGAKIEAKNKKKAQAAQLKKNAKTPTKLILGKLKPTKSIPKASVVLKRGTKSIKR